MPETFYDLLGVSRRATSEEIQEAYRRVSKKLHPNADPEMPPAQFRQLKEARDVLLDEGRRAEYDLSLDGAGRGTPRRETPQEPPRPQQEPSPEGSGQSTYRARAAGSDHQDRGRAYADRIRPEQRQVLPGYVPLLWAVVGGLAGGLLQPMFARFADDLMDANSEVGHRVPWLVRGLCHSEGGLCLGFVCMILAYTGFLVGALGGMIMTMVWWNRGAPRLRISLRSISLTGLVALILLAVGIIGRIAPRSKVPNPPAVSIEEVARWFDAAEKIPADPSAIRAVLSDAVRDSRDETSFEARRRAAEDAQRRTQALQALLRKSFVIECDIPLSPAVYDFDTQVFCAEIQRTISLEYSGEDGRAVSEYCLDFGAGEVLSIGVEKDVLHQMSQRHRITQYGGALLYAAVGEATARAWERQHLRATATWVVRVLEPKPADPIQHSIDLHAIALRVVLPGQSPSYWAWPEPSR